MQLAVHTFAEEADRLADHLTLCGAESVTCQDAGDQPIYEPDLGTCPLWPDTKVTGLFDTPIDLNILIEQLKSKFPEATHWQLAPLEEKDWVREWMRYFSPMRFGQRLWICPSWQPAPEPTAVNVLLDPGLAFGTGTHPTTALCLEWLDQFDLSETNVIDYGCGSGILSIAAVKLGASHVWAVDTDPQALTATVDNSHKNEVADKITPVLPQDLPAIKGDIVLANILAKPLEKLAGTLTQLVQPRGHIVLSGILGEQAETLLSHYGQWFQMEPVTIKKQWVRLVGQKN